MSIAGDVIDDIIESQDIIDRSSFEDILSLIQGQIDDPFGSNEDHLETLLSKIEDKNHRKDLCGAILVSILKENSYIKINLDDMDDIVTTTKSIYRVFIKNRKKITYIFLREFILKPKTRKICVDDIKVGSGYNRLYHGKKEYYTLLMKMPKVVKVIRDMNIDFDRFLKHLTKGYVKGYIKYVEELHTAGVISFKNFGEEFLNPFIDNGEATNVYTLLMQDVRRELISPCVEDAASPSRILSEPEMPDNDDDSSDEESDNNLRDYTS